MRQSMHSVRSVTLDGVMDNTQLGRVSAKMLQYRIIRNRDRAIAPLLCLVLTRLHDSNDQESLKRCRSSLRRNEVTLADTKSTSQPGLSKSVLTQRGFGCADERSGVRFTAHQLRSAAHFARPDCHRLSHVLHPQKPGERVQSDFGGTHKKN